VPWLDRIERRLGWLSFPGLFRFYVLLGVLAFALSWMRPDLAAILEFDRARIIRGEVWRLVTFLFAQNAAGGFSLLAVVFLYFAVIIGFLINDSLEGVWGAFRMSMFLYTGFVSLLLANLLLPAVAWSGGMFYTSAFFAFATHFPRYEFLLFFILPVQVRFLAWIGAAGLVLSAISQPATIPFILAAFLNYFLFVALPFLRDRRSMAEAAVRRRKFKRASEPEAESFHRCEVCGRTEKDPAGLEFRVGRDGREYCTEHLPDDGRD
jgi:hypothetical protein